MSVKSISFRMEEEMLDKLGYVAEYEGRSVNSHVLRSLKTRTWSWPSGMGRPVEQNM